MTSRTERESDQTKIHPSHQQSGYTIRTSDITPSAEITKITIESNHHPADATPTRLKFLTPKPKQRGADLQAA